MCNKKIFEMFPQLKSQKLGLGEKKLLSKSSAWETLADIISMGA